MTRSCRMCEATENLTKHHLLKKGGHRRLGIEAPPLVVLCRPCHDLLHGGDDLDRERAYEDLKRVLSAAELDLLARKPQEIWQRRLELARIPKGALPE